jgi:alpha-ribazole phosphatase
MNLRLLLVRHGLTDWNVKKRFQGQTNIPLNKTGIRQAQALGDRIAGESIDHIYASDLDRARQTARFISQHHSCPLEFNPALRELHFGDWEGLTYQQIQDRDPDILKAWNLDLYENGPPAGESLRTLIARISTFLDIIFNAHNDETVLLVTHGGCLQVLCCLALDLPPQQYWQFRLSPASLSEIRYFSAGATINSLNNTNHLHS